MHYRQRRSGMASPSSADASRDGTAVVICTRYCPPGAADAVRSALGTSPGPRFIVVVDQSDPAGDDALAEFAHDSRVIRVRSDSRGLSCARNIGTSIALSEGAAMVAYTDDDCTVETGWLGALADAMGSASDVGLVFGSTVPATTACPTDVIPSYMPRHQSLYRGLSSKPRVEGMGACMAVRADAWSAIGGFDEYLGAGTPLCSADENDLCIRLLRAGYAVAETPRAEVLHHGVRHRGSVEEMVGGYMRGTGAASAKMLRLCGPSAIRPLAAIAWRWLRGGSAVNIGPAPRRWHRLLHFLLGASVGLTMPLDPRTGRFIARGQARQAAE